VTDLLSAYIAPPTPEEQWRVILSLAAAPSPAQACRASNWRAELFTDEAAIAAFNRLPGAQRPVQIPLPPALDGIVAYTDEELQKVRQRMARSVLLTRYLPDYQGNLRDNLFRFTQVQPAADGDLDSVIKEMLDATLSSMETSFQTLRAIVSPAPRDSMVVVTQAELDASYWEYWERMAQQKQAIPTGFGSLNRLLNGGLREGRVVTFLGGPGGGKTTFCNQVAEETANRGRPVVYLACEEPGATLYAKSLARLGKVNYAAAQFGWEAQRGQIDQARVRLRNRRSSNRLLYVEGCLDLPTLTEVARRHFERYGPESEEQDGGAGILVVDYLQVVAQMLMRSGTFQAARDENQVIGLLMYELRLLAKLLNCVVLVISSQNRASGYGNNNPLSSGRGSGFIEYSSDILISVDKVKEEDQPLTLALKEQGFEWRRLNLSKNRLGAPGDCELLWRGVYQEFSEPLSSPGEFDDEEDEDDDD
jgi:replicative DNA helicase